MTTPVPGLDGDEEILWRSLVELLLRLPRVLDEHFEREAKVSMTDYSAADVFTTANAAALVNSSRIDAGVLGPFGIHP